RRRLAPRLRRPRTRSPSGVARDAKGLPSRCSRAGLARRTTGRPVRSGARRPPDRQRRQGTTGGGHFACLDEEGVALDLVPIFEQAALGSTGSAGAVGRV